MSNNASAQTGPAGGPDAPDSALLDAVKADLWADLRRGREALLAKLAGLSPYDARRPMTRTGTNLVGLLKHCVWCEAGYFGATFGRPFPEPSPHDLPDADDNDDMYAATDESVADVVALAHRVWAHADETIANLPLTATGRVPWWPPERPEVTLALILSRVITDVHRHAGHADVLRELLDGSAGWRPDQSALPDYDEAQWAAYVDRLESIARQATG